MAAISPRTRNEVYGYPCSSGRRVTAEVWGQRVQVHHLIHNHFVRTCIAAHHALNLAGKGHLYPKRVDSFVCRRIAGSSSWSLHAYGLAWDMFLTPPGVPPPGGVWTPDHELPHEFVRAFIAAGFTWGGTWTRRDTPHFQWDSLPKLY